MEGAESPPSAAAGTADSSSSTFASPCPTVSPNLWEFTTEMAPRDPAGIRRELGSAQGAVFLVWYVSSVEAGAAVDLRVEVVPGWWDSVGSV